ncbi:hypothetical protein BDQ17DRAFT_1372460 [Cyathus striatus]|nr:hypothetical protein BDQ17DRAFT_1372460 [Cyathus striatus]
MSTATAYASTSSAPDFPKRADGHDIEPDEEWKAKLKQSIEEGLQSMVKDAKDNLENSLRQMGISDEDRDRFKADYAHIMRNVRKLATESYHAELERERNERRWAAGIPISTGWTHALQQEQTDIMETIKRTNQGGGTSASPTTSPIEERRRTSTASRAAAERAAQGAGVQQAPPAQDIKRPTAPEAGPSASPSSSPTEDRRHTSSSSASRAAAERTAPVAPPPPQPQEPPPQRTYDQSTKPRYTSDNAAPPPRDKDEFMASVGQSIRKSSGGRPPVPRTWAPPPSAELDSEVDTEDEPMVRREPRLRPSMEMKPIRETEVRPTEPPSRSGSISERNSARSPPKPIPTIWKPSVTPEEDAATSRPSVTPVRRNSTASLQSNGSAGRRPSIVETIPERPETTSTNSGRFPREKERQNESDKPWSPHDNVRDREKQVRPKMSREDVRHTEDYIASPIKSPGSPYPTSNPYQGTSSPRRVASKASLNSDSGRPTGERRAHPKPVNLDSLDDDLPPRPLLKTYYDRPPTAGSQPFVRSPSGAVHEERPYQPGMAENSQRRVASKPSVSFSEDIDRQTGRYAAPHNASPLSASRPPERYSTPPSASRSRRDHGSDDEYDEETMYDDPRAYGRRPLLDETPDHAYSNSRPVPSRQSSYKREEERRRNDDDGYSRHLYSSPASNPISVPRRSPNVVVDEPVVGSWKDWNGSQRPSESRHDHPRVYSNQFHPPMWAPSSYVGDRVDSPAQRAFGGKKPPPKVDSDIEDYDEYEELNRLDEETLQKEEEELMFMEDTLKKKTAEAQMKEMEAQKKAIEARRKQLEMRKSETEARLKEAESRAMAAEQKLREQKAKEREREERKRAEEARQKEEEVRQKKEAARMKEEETRRVEERYRGKKREGRKGYTEPDAEDTETDAETARERTSRMEEERERLRLEEEEERLRLDEEERMRLMKRRDCV